MKKSKSLEISILLSSLLIVGALVYSANAKKDIRGKTETAAKANKTEKITEDNYEQKVIPEDGVVLPAKWGDLGAKMTSVGVIDKSKLEELYAGRGGLNDEERNLLEGLDNDYLKITPENSGFVLNLLWALGLGNKNEILDNGPMTDKKYGGAGRFASTGGWTLADGGPPRNGGGGVNHFFQQRVCFFNIRTTSARGKSCQRNLSSLLRESRLLSRLQSRHGHAGVAGTNGLAGRVGRGNVQSGSGRQFVLVSGYLPDYRQVSESAG